MAIGLQPISTLVFLIWTLICFEIHCTRPPDDCVQLASCHCLTSDQQSVTGTTGVTGVRCSDSLFTVVPKPELSQFSNSLRLLVLTGNNFSNLNGLSFPAMPSVEELILSENGLRSFEPSTFQQFKKLVKLDLSQNHLTETFETTSFQHPNVIRELNLSFNQISRLGDAAFITLTELTQLDLSNNSIDSISAGAFQGLEKLSRLNVSSNRISQLHATTFHIGLSHLTELNLERNEIQDIAPHTFVRLTSLVWLNLARNSLRYVSPDTFEGLQHLINLDLSDNRVRFLSDRWITRLPLLEHLDLSGNPLLTLEQYKLSPAPKLSELDINRMPEMVAVTSGALSDLPALKRISFNGSSRLKYLNANMLGTETSAVERLDLFGCNLQSLSRDLVRNSMPELNSISLQNNQWRCDCSLKWLSDFIKSNPRIFQGDLQSISCVYPEELKGKGLIETDLYQHANCSNTTISHYIPNVRFRLGSTALLECQAEGNPKPQVSWYTPVSNVLHWSPLSSSNDLNPYTSVNHPGYHDTNGVPIPGRRLQVLRNGNLFISPVETEDAGMYVCVAGNSLGNSTVYMSMTLDFGMLQHIKIVSILVGLAVSVAFMLMMLIVQLVQMILNRWGWCCCRAALPPKAKRIRKMLESVEHYKSQQLDRLRDNYNMQVQKIKDNCTQQMEKLRDSYSSQTERLRDFRDYGTHQIDRIRDQYYEQVRRVRDYSAQQMSRVRENYVVQRNRIRKFSAHQLFKLRENYKVQQLHLNKILENLNLESCRTVCARTDSVLFSSEVVSMSPSLPPDLDFTQPIPDSISSDLVEIELQKFVLPPLKHLRTNALGDYDDLDEDDDDDNMSFKDAMDGTEFQMVKGLQDTFIVDPNDPDYQLGQRPMNDIVV